ncbi:MAG TPA: apolipoprotein N-acyltransferase, partial [Pirellulaceae bacterium]|nr:apolipoprotein N-acyltransferase [Pirellulaceae bacterium]
LAATLGYGYWRLNQTPPGAAGPVAKIALIQGSIDTVFEPPTSEKVRATYDHYNTLMADAVTEQPNLDLVVWPESMFVIPERMIEEPLVVPADAGISTDELRSGIAAASSEFEMVLAAEAARANENSESTGPGTHLLVGTNTFIYGQNQPRSYNTALLANRHGKVAGRYYKTHAVMFGEYIPFGDVLPWIYRLTPMPGGMSVGEGPEAFEIAGLRMSPSICFESTVPHLIRGQVIELARRDQPVDVLVNVTNDGWFWGSGILDQHLRCGVLRAVENRKPLVVAANTGISAHIDGNGVIRQRGPKRDRQAIVAQVQADGRISPYHWLGDLPANVCALACLGLALVGSLNWNSSTNQAS